MWFPGEAYTCITEPVTFPDDWPSPQLTVYVPVPGIVMDSSAAVVSQVVMKAGGLVSAWPVTVMTTVCRLLLPKSAEPDATTVMVYSSWSESAEVMLRRLPPEISK